MADELEELVLLYDGNSYSYGKLTMNDKNKTIYNRYGRNERTFGVEGEIEEDLLQKNIIIPFGSEEEKNEIFSVIPDGFYAKIMGENYTRGSIVVEFEKQEISAPLYVNKHYRNTYECEDTKEFKTISATLKTKELTKKIIDFMANIYRIKSKYYEKYLDKYDASSSCKYYLQWLVGTGQAEVLDKKGEVSLEEYKRLINSDFDSTSFKVRYNGREYSIGFGDIDSWSYYTNFNGLEKDYQEFVEELKKQGEYFLPGTEIPRYSAPKNGIGYVKNGENQYILADRMQVYKTLNGQSIFKNSFILTENNEMFYGVGEETKFSDVLHTKNRNSYYEEIEILLGYNDEQIMFLHNKRGQYERGGLVSSDKIQRFERENTEQPVTIFSIGNTSGFIDGNKVRITNENGELAVFEIEEEVNGIEIKDGYVLINGNILCCGAKDGHEGWTDKTIIPLCKKINNPEIFERSMQNPDKILLKDFIENENGCFLIKGLSDEEKLSLYLENGFNKLYEKLALTIRERQEAQEEEKRKKEEARQKTHEYLNGKMLTQCHIRKGRGNGERIIEAGDIDITENNDVVILYEKQEKGWAYGPVYDTGILYVPEVKKKIKTGKLHLNVPEEYMGMIIGSKGSNINFVTEQLKKKGVDVSKIILHPKTKEEMSQITTSSIKDACLNAKKSIEI